VGEGRKHQGRGPMDKLAGGERRGKDALFPHRLDGMRPAASEGERLS
jgi:hypothetical protein